MDLLSSNKSLGTHEKTETIEKLIHLFENYLRAFKEKLKLNSLFNKIEDIFYNDIDILA